MNYDVINEYFVPHGATVNPLTSVHPKKALPHKVKTGDVFKTSHKKLGPDPFPGIRKDLVVHTVGDDGKIYSWPFPEIVDGNKEIIIIIP